MYWRRKLPHWTPDEAILFLTWRLAGTLPSGLFLEQATAGERFLLSDRELDRARTGPLWLSDPRVARMFADALQYGAAARQAYELFAWVVMPNHVHVVMRPAAPLPEIMRWLKTATAARANRLIGRNGQAFWQREYFDHWIRSENEFLSIVAYVEGNPGLASTPEEWPWSSAASGTGDLCRRS